MVRNGLVEGIALASREYGTAEKSVTDSLGLVTVGLSTATSSSADGGVVDRRHPSALPSLFHQHGSSSASLLGKALSTAETNGSFKVTPLADVGRRVSEPPPFGSSLAGFWQTK